MRNFFRKYFLTRVWVLRIEIDPFNQIANDQKVVAGKVPDPQNPQKEYSAIKPGDIIHFVPILGRQSGLFKDREYKCIPLAHPLIIQASYVKKYPSVEAMLRNEGLDKVLPGCKSIEEGIELYHNFPGCQENIAKNGIIAIGLDMKTKRIVYWSDITKKVSMEKIKQKWILMGPGWPGIPDVNMISELCSLGLSWQFITTGQKKLSEEEKRWKEFLHGMMMGLLSAKREFELAPKERSIKRMFGGMSLEKNSGNKKEKKGKKKKKEKEIVKKVKFPY